MKLLVGLGNPGPKYAKNRHNVGFQFVDYVVEQPEMKKLILKNETQFNAGVIKLPDLIIAKPQEFMNKSGLPVQKLMQFYKILPEDVFVAFDDLDIALGSFKIILRGPQIHNGISSVKNSIGNTFTKIRIGIENRDPLNRMPGETFVLQDFTAEEKKLTEDTFKNMYNQLIKLIL